MARLSESHIEAKDFFQSLLQITILVSGEQLPADYREVIILRHLEGLSFPDVAQRMGRTVDSVDKLWARALARLRRSLGAES